MIRLLHKTPGEWSVVFSPEMSFDGFTSERAAGQFVADWMVAMMMRTERKDVVTDARAVAAAVKRALRGKGNE